MSNKSLLNRLNLPELSAEIHDNCVITSVDVNDRKGQNGIIPKMVYIKFTKYNDENKRIAASELAWWKPDATSDYFVDNLRSICIQLHGILSCYMTEEEAFTAMENVFDGFELESHLDVEQKKWKITEVNSLLTQLGNAFKAAISSHLNNMDNKIRVKLMTNFKGEGLDIPKYGKFTESMTVDPSDLSYSDKELQTMSKSGNVETKSTISKVSSKVNI